MYKKICKQNVITLYACALRPNASPGFFSSSVKNMSHF